MFNVYDLAIQKAMDGGSTEECIEAVLAAVPPHVRQSTEKLAGVIETVMWKLNGLRKENSDDLLLKLAPDKVDAQRYIDQENKKAALFADAMAEQGIDLIDVFAMAKKEIAEGRYD